LRNGEAIFVYGAFVSTAIGIPQEDAYENRNLWIPDGNKRLILLQGSRVFTTLGREKTIPWVCRRLA